jgi:hypothetical protein
MVAAVKKENPPDVADESFHNRNNHPAPRKPNLRMAAPTNPLVSSHVV